MRTVVDQDQPVSPMRLLEILVDRFGAFEAIAYSSIKLAHFARQTSSRWTRSLRTRC
jgi:hypothetical protein